MLSFVGAARLRRGHLCVHERVAPSHMTERNCQIAGQTSQMKPFEITDEAVEITDEAV